MKNADSNSIPRQPDPGNLDQSELVSNQEVTVIPYFAGERVVAVTWVSPVYNLYDAGSGNKKG